MKKLLGVKMDMRDAPFEVSIVVAWTGSSGALRSSETPFVLCSLFILHRRMENKKKKMVFVCNVYRGITLIYMGSGF